jgi:butyrate kinase
MKQILVINPGSTSTKIGVFENERQIHGVSLHHSTEQLTKYSEIWDQRWFRERAIIDWLVEHSVDLHSLTAIVARGGLLSPIPSGTYTINEAMVHDLELGLYGKHACNLAALIAYDLGQKLNIPSYIVDPVVVDEMSPLAKISGTPEIERVSVFHALNQKAIAKKVAEMLHRRYDELNLIVAHLGGGISIGVHQKGKVVDVNNALNGEGPFSPERTGTLPTTELIHYFFAHDFSTDTLIKRFSSKSGLVAHLGTNDSRVIVDRMRTGDKKAQFYFEAMAYQIAKELGRAAAVLEGRIDRIVLTGGLAHSSTLTDLIREYVGFLGEIVIVPGENELEALALGALRVLMGQEGAAEYNPRGGERMPRGRVIVHKERCKECSLCITTCPHSVLGFSETINAKGFHPVTSILPEKCTGCTLCAVICPDLVLTVERV